MKKFYTTFKPPLRIKDPTSNNTPTKNRTNCNQTTYKEALLNTKYNEHNNSTATFYEKTNNHLLNESSKAKTTINDIIIDDEESLPDLAERYDSESENEEDDYNTYNKQEKRKVTREIPTQYKRTENDLQNKLETTFCMPCFTSSISITLKVHRKLKYIFHCRHTK